MKTYQDRQRKFVMDYGFILLNPKTRHKAYIYDYDKLMDIQKRFTQEFWTARRPYKKKESWHSKNVIAQICDRFAEGTPIDQMVGTYTRVEKRRDSKGNVKTSTYYETVSYADAYNYPVKHFFKRKSDSEKQAINYPCQASGALMFKTASILLFEYLREHNLLFKVKLCIPCHDEWNIEVPEEYKDELTEVLKDCMSKAGAFFCPKLELPADAEVSDHWIH